MIRQRKESLPTRARRGGFDERRNQGPISRAGNKQIFSRFVYIYIYILNKNRLIRACAAEAVYIQGGSVRGGGMVVGPRRVPSSRRQVPVSSRLLGGLDRNGALGLGQPIACRPSVWRLTAAIPGWVSWWLSWVVFS
jgi:hypothetical protein